MENLQRAYGLDLPLHEQYLRYLGNLLRGDLGPSFFMRDFSVAQILMQGLPVSMALGGGAILLALILGAGLGAFAAMRQNTGADHAVVGFATAGVTIPNFVVAPVLQIVFGLTLAWLPVGGWNNGALRNMILPVIVLALPQIAVVARMTRAAMIETLRADHIRTLRSLGLGAVTLPSTGCARPCCRSSRISAPRRRRC